MKEDSCGNIRWLQGEEKTDAAGEQLWEEDRMAVKKREEKTAAAKKEVGSRNNGSRKKRIYLQQENS